ncbi:MAG: MoxR family ATPase [Acidobacteria bacterium]|nr:MoxR family ATPase [Acidobacteriota bacterium]
MALAGNSSALRTASSRNCSPFLDPSFVLVAANVAQLVNFDDGSVRKARHDLKLTAHIQPPCAERSLILYTPQSLTLAYAGFTRRVSSWVVPASTWKRRGAPCFAGLACQFLDVNRGGRVCMHPELQEAIDFHKAIVAEGSKALVGYDTEKALANVVLLSEIPTTYDKNDQRQVNAGNLLLRGVPGIGKTFFGVILAAISDAKFARIQGRADLQPTEVVGYQMINPATGQMVTEFGPLASAEVILLDEINRIPLKSQSAFLEALQDRTVTVGKTTYELPAFSFAIATMNPVELGQGTFPLSEAATDRFAMMVSIGYLPPEEEQRLVSFDFKKVRLDKLLTKERIIQLRAAISREVFLHEKLAEYIRRLVGASRPYSPDTAWYHHSPSEMVEHSVDLGASPRATICWGRLVKVWALIARERAEVYPEDIQAIAKYVLGHRIWLGPHAASHGLTVEVVIDDICSRVPIP